MTKHDRYLDEIDPGEDRPGPGQKKRRTGRRIFRSAIELMQKDGFDGVSIEQICDRAGVARATFFQHFSSKAALLSAFSDIVCQHLDEELAVANLTPIDQLRLVASNLQRMISDLGTVGPDLLAAFSAEGGNRFKFDDPNTGVTFRIKGIVEAGQADGSFSDTWLAEDIAITLVAAWVGVSRRRVERGEDADGADLLDILDLILRGVAAKA